MTTQQMIEAIQEKIADKTPSKWCMIRFDDWQRWQITQAQMLRASTEEKNCWMKDEMEYLLCYFTSSGTFKKIYREENIDKIIWHPVSLARVLNALGDTYWYDWHRWWIVHYELWHNSLDYTQSFDYWIWRNLRNEDWSDCMLDSQSEETIEALYNIICK